MKQEKKLSFFCSWVYLKPNRKGNKIIVSFDISNTRECECEMNDIKFCPKCKLCRDIKMFNSLNKNVDFNRLCRECLARQLPMRRRCLNMMNGNKTKSILYR